MFCVWIPLLNFITFHFAPYLIPLLILSAASQKDKDDVINSGENEAIYFTAFSESTRIEGWLDMKSMPNKLKESKPYRFITIFLFCFAFKYVLMN